MLGGENQPRPTAKAEDPATEKLRINKAFWLSIVGLGLAAALVGVLLLAGWDTASDITSVVGLFTSVLGTLVGAFFGLQIGSAGKAEADARAKSAQKKADALSAAADEETITRASALYRDLFT